MRSWPDALVPPRGTASELCGTIWGAWPVGQRALPPAGVRWALPAAVPPQRPTPKREARGTDQPGGPEIGAGAPIL